MVNGYLYIPKVEELDGGIYRCAKTVTFLNASCRYPIKGSYQGFWGSGEKCHFQGLMKKGYLFSGMSKASKILFFFGWGENGSMEYGSEEKHFRDLGRTVIFLSGSLLSFR